MIKKIRSSLFAKVFIITSMMLLCISLLVFGLLAWLMPQTYSNKLNTFLDRQTQEFISELEKVTFSDSGGLFDQFIQNMEINSVELYDTTGMLITLPSEQFYDSYGANVAQESDDDLDEGNPVLSTNYYFSFLGSNTFRVLLILITTEDGLYTITWNRNAITFPFLWDILMMNEVERQFCMFMRTEFKYRP